MFLNGVSSSWSSSSSSSFVFDASGLLPGPSGEVHCISLAESKGCWGMVGHGYLILPVTWKCSPRNCRLEQVFLQIFRCRQLPRTSQRKKVQGQHGSQLFWKFALQLLFLRIAKPLRHLPLILTARQIQNPAHKPCSASLSPDFDDFDDLSNRETCIYRFECLKLSWSFRWKAGDSGDSSASDSGGIDPSKTRGGVVSTSICTSTFQGVPIKSNPKGWWIHTLWERFGTRWKVQACLYILNVWLGVFLGLQICPKEISWYKSIE